MKIIKENFSKYLDLSDELTKYLNNNFKPENYNNVTLHLLFNEKINTYDKIEEFTLSPIFKECVLNNFIDSEDTLKNVHIASDFFRDIFYGVLNKVLKNYNDDNKHFYVYLCEIKYECFFDNKIVVKYFLSSSSNFDYTDNL